MKSCIIGVLTVVLAGTCALMRATADEVDEALGLEASMATETGSVQVAHEAQDEPAQDTLPTESVMTPCARRDLASLSRQQLEMEVLTAEAEIERLKDIVRRILVANRREKESMHYNVGCVLRAAGQHRKAEQAFLQALELNPRDPAVHYNLGILYDEDLGIADKAKKHYEIFLALSPDDEDAGRVYQWLTALK